MRRATWMVSIMMCLAIVLAGCGIGKKDSAGVVKDLDRVMNKLDSYHGAGKMTLHTGLEPQEYAVDVSFQAPHYYRISLTNEKKDITQIVLRNDDGVFVLTPHLNKSFRFQSDWPENQGQVYLYQSLAQSILMDNERQFTMDKDSYVFDVQANYQNGSLARQKVWLNKKDLAPTHVEVSDANSNVMVIVDFKEFEFGKKFDKDSFDMQRNMTSYNIQKSMPAAAQTGDGASKDAGGAASGKGTDAKATTGAANSNNNGTAGQAGKGDANGAAGANAQTSNGAANQSNGTAGQAGKGNANGAAGANAQTGNGAANQSNGTAGQAGKGNANGAAGANAQTGNGAANQSNGTAEQAGNGSSGGKNQAGGTASNGSAANGTAGNNSATGAGTTGLAAGAGAAGNSSATGGASAKGSTNGANGAIAGSAAGATPGGATAGSAAGATPSGATGSDGSKATAAKQQFGVIEPTYIPSGVKKQDIRDMKLGEDQAVLLRYSGKFNYTLVESMPQAQTVSSLPGDIVDLGYTLAVITGDSKKTLTWTYDGVEFRLSTGDLPLDEMIKVAQAVQGQVGK
ncbi:outer membrane lipoprotein carrier protein LolA [Paenibacillus hamazuiensis]|uniref:outer membrane lipoprotein carrier protein LolA n=1 Tax=Paenibacillus hamazuiensis TaxID=2936508 RepID=UPI003B846417